MQKRARTLKSKTLYRGRVVELKVDRVIEPGVWRRRAKLFVTRAPSWSFPIFPTADRSWFANTGTPRRKVCGSLWPAGWKKVKRLARVRAANLWRKPDTTPAP